MPLFEYEAINIEHYTRLKGVYKKPGQLEQFVNEFGQRAQIISGTMEAVTPEEVRDKLNEAGYHPLRLNLVVRDHQGIVWLQRLKKKRDAVISTLTQKQEMPKVSRRRLNIKWPDVIAIAIAMTILALALMAK